MSNTWQNSFAELKEIHRSKPLHRNYRQLHLHSGPTCAGVLRLFDTVRANFLKDNFPASLEKGYELSRASPGYTRRIGGFPSWNLSMFAPPSTGSCKTPSTA
jgi:hypothetical protein